MQETELGEQVAKVVQEKAEEANRMMSYINGKIPSLLDFGLKLLIAGIIFFIGSRVIALLLKILKRSFVRAQMEEGSLHFMNSLIKALLYIILVAGLAAYLGVKEASIAALLGSMGVGIVLALKESLSNLAGGFILLIMKPFTVGDYIKEDAHGNEGTVEKIDLFYTYLLTPDNRTVSVPNGTLSNTSLTNISRQEKRQIRQIVGISYQADIQMAKKTIEKILKEEESVLAAEPAEVFVDSLNESSVDLGWRVWVRPEDYFAVKWRLTEAIKYGLDEVGIEIPYRQLEVAVRQAEKE
ncbi:mechanosensitive ion channel family protein [Lachnospiraceae bacterium 46-15]